MTPAPNIGTAVKALRSVSAKTAPGERCELCGLMLGAAHRHLLQPDNARLSCACDACAVLFAHRGGRFRAVPRKARRLERFSIADEQWMGLRLPIDLAFFLNSTPCARTVAYYPSPAGNTESLLSLDAWGAVAKANPAVEEMENDVEALLIDRTRGNRRYYIAPIDQCYRLTGLIRSQWRGFSGGDAVWLAVDRFFGDLEGNSDA